jgi:hypothetical protein
MNCRGQALIESVPFFMVVAGLIGIVLNFSQWFLTHQKLLIAARGGAMLYSSGRLTRNEAQRRVRAYLSAGSIPLDARRVSVAIGHSTDRLAHFYHLDEVRVRYVPSSRLQQFFESIMEEKCVIKHAPRYGPPFPAVLGPPVNW